MANSVDPDQTAPEGAVWPGTTLFAYAILSVTLVYYFTVIRNHLGLTTAGFHSEVVSISSGLNSRILLYILFEKKKKKKKKKKKNKGLS